MMSIPMGPGFDARSRAVLSRSLNRKQERCNGLLRTNFPLIGISDRFCEVAKQDSDERTKLWPKALQDIFDFSFWLIVAAFSFSLAGFLYFALENQQVV